MRQLLVTFDTTLLLRLIEADVIIQGTYEDVKHRRMTRTKWRFFYSSATCCSTRQKKSTCTIWNCFHLPISYAIDKIYQRILDLCYDTDNSIFVRLSHLKKYYFYIFHFQILHYIDPLMLHLHFPQNWKHWSFWDQITSPPPLPLILKAHFLSDVMLAIAHASLLIEHKTVLSVLCDLCVVI